MEKTLLYKLFGFGKMPSEIKESLQHEGIRFLEEGIRVSVTYKNFRTPVKYHSLKKEFFPGSLALTENRVIGFAYTKRIINVGFDETKFDYLDIVLEKEKKLAVTFDVSKFQDDMSGILTYRSSTPNALGIAEFIESKTSTSIKGVDRLKKK